MTGSAKRRDGVSPSLFPFLAVLLCTMGAMVLILMLTVSGAQSTTHQLVSEIEEQVELEEAKIHLVKQGLTEKLEESRIQLEKKRLALQHLEQHIRELSDELEQLLKQVELAEATKDPKSTNDTDRQRLISELEKQLAEAAEELQQKLDQPDGDKPIFAIIPYDGPNGTHRRPIYLECTAKGLVIQPEGVLVPPSDLRPPYGPGNPLDAALRAIRAEFPSKNGSVTSNPYPLLIVRPSGIKHYMMARAAMSGWDDQFGYELVSENLDLAYPPSLPHLPQKIVQALEVARQRQAALVMAMPQHYSGLEPFSNELGFASDGGSNSQSAGSGLGNSENWPSGELTAPSESTFGDSTESRPTVFLAGGGGSTNGMSGMSSNDFSNGSNTVESTSLVAGQNPSGTVNSPGLTRPSQPSQSAGTPSGTGGPSAAQTSGGSFTENAGATHGNGPGGTSDSRAAGKASGGTTGSETSGNPNGSGGNASGMAAAASASAVNSPLPGSLSPNGSGRNSAGGSPQSSMNSSVASDVSGVAGQAGGTCDQDCQSQQMDPNTPVPNNLNVTLNRSQAESARPVAAARGANWAWDRPQRTQTAVVRAIRVRCYNDCWIVLPEKGSHRPPDTIRFDDPPEKRAEQLAKIVRRRVENWGVALAEGHWTPVLHVEVASDADWRFSQLQRLMEGSGLDVQKKGTIPPNHP